MSFVLYYNHQRKLKSLKYQTPFDIVCNAFEIEPVNFKQNSNHMLLELNINTLGLDLEKLYNKS